MAHMVHLGVGAGAGHLGNDPGAAEIGPASDSGSGGLGWLAGLDSSDLNDYALGYSGNAAEQAEAKRILAERAGGGTIDPNFITVYDEDGNVLGFKDPNNPDGPLIKVKDVAGGPSGPPVGGRDNPSVSYSYSESVSGSYYIPNALDFLDAQLKLLDTQMANNQITQANAIVQFNAAVEKIAQEIEINISNANRDLDAQRAQATAEIDIFDIQRSTRQRVAEDYTKNILPFQMPEGYGLNLPMIGNVPSISLDLNTIYDIPGINAAPDIDITAPVVQPINPDRYPGIPDTPQVDFDFQAELDRLLAMGVKPI